MVSPKNQGLALWLGLALLVLVLDQFTKVLVLGAFQLGDSTPITSFFNLVRVHNHGAAFSFLAGAGGWQRWFFTGIGVAAAIFMVWMLRAHPGQKLFSLAISLILGGAIGNVVDRLLHGYGRLSGLLLGRLALPGFQCGRCRHQRGRGAADPGRNPAGAARTLKPTQSTD